MKNRKTILLVIVLVLLAAIISIYFFSKNKTSVTNFGNSTKSSKDVTNKDASFSVVKYSGTKIENGTKVNFLKFKGVRDVYDINMEKGSSLNIHFKSDSLKMAVVDENYKLLKDFGTGKEYSYELKSAKTQKYYVRVYGNKDNGNFTIFFDNIDKVKIEASNFWK